MAESLVDQVNHLINARGAFDLASRFSNFTPTVGDLSKAWRAARETLASTPDRGSWCVPMTAEFLYRIQESLSAPVIVVAGAVRALGALEELIVFGSGEPMDCDSLFERSQTDWDGHVWLMLGPYIADVSIFRSIKLDVKRPRLREFIGNRFKVGDGALIMRWDEVRPKGLKYIAQCALSEAQAQRLVETAWFPEDLQT